MRQSFAYTAYGLGLRSELPLPELSAVETARHDVEIRFGPVEKFRRREMGRRHYAELTPRQARLYWEEVGAFHVADGRTITIDPVPEASEEGIRLLLLGSVFGVLLHQRGQMLLHASAVEIDGGAVGFLGHSGWGKSTTAAAFHRSGYRVIADDITAIDISENGEAVVTPGFPQLKLRSDSASALGLSSTALHTLHARVEKRGLRCAETFTHTPLPLRRLYVLAEGDTPAIETVPARAAIVELVRHSYAATILRATSAEQEHLLRCAALLPNVQVRRLIKGSTLDDLPRIVSMICEDSRV